MPKKLDWDRVERERRLAKHGGERANLEHIRAVPASDKVVARLVALGYSGKRPATSAEARELIRKLRKAPAASETRAAPLGDVEVLIDEFARFGTRARFDGQVLGAKLKDAYERELASIESSRAKATTKWNRVLELTSQHMRLKGRLEKARRK